MLKSIIRNKYKLIAAILLLLLLADAWRHKGLVRILLPKSFGDTAIAPVTPKEKVPLINSGKQWKKAINTVDLVNNLDPAVPGFECDVYFDTARRVFDVHHDAGKSNGLDLETILQTCKTKKLDVSIWLDFKNCDVSNNHQALGALLGLQQRYQLNDKIIVESWNTDALSIFTDSGFYTSYNVPLFNPYSIGKDSLRKWGRSISEKLSRSHISALSGYYFQYPFFKANFPEYPVLIWSPASNFSLAGWLYKRRINGDAAVFINLE